MDKNNSFLKWACVVLAVIAIGAAGFFAGRYEADSKYQAERERNILINRSELDGLVPVEGPIYVTGHKSPDADTVGSSIGYAALLRQLGYDAQPVVLGEINKETAYILEQGGIEVPMLLDNAAGCNMVLMDHSDYLQSVDGLEEALIISIIDHHGDGTVMTGNQLIYDARPIGSTATIVWIRYRNFGLTPDPKSACAMVGSILSDTHKLGSDTTTYADREALKELSAIAGINDTNAMYREMYKASISYEGMTDEEIFYSDYKEYETDGRTFGIACVNAYDEEAAKDYAERMNRLIPEVLAETGLDYLFAQISIFHDDVSITYLVPSDRAAAGVIEEAFGEKAVFDGTSYRLEPGISRKQVLVPAITDVLNAHPKE